jgi:hypothetical protein
LQPPRAIVLSTFAAGLGMLAIFVIRFRRNLRALARLEPLQPVRATGFDGPPHATSAG